MRLFSLILSLLVHVAVFGLAFYSPIAGMLRQETERVYSVELVQPPERTAPKEELPPEPSPAEEPGPSDRQVPPETTQQQTPAPPPEPEQPQAPPLGPTEKPPSPGPEPQPAVEAPGPAPPPPGTTAVSAVKRGVQTSWETAVRERHNATGSEKLVLEQGLHLSFGDSNQTVTLKTGAEARALRAMAVRDFGVDDYNGFYQMTRDWHLNIVDARRVYGTMLFYDSDSGLYRDLFKFGKMIYTYGPEFTENIPVRGSITFLATKEGISERDVPWPSRVLWMPEEQAARFATRVYFREEPVRIQSGFFYLAGKLITPPGQGPFPGVVFALDGECLPLELVSGFARMLCRHGIAVLVLQPVGCDGSSDVWWERSQDEIGQDLLAGVTYLQQLQTIDPGRIGLWALNQGNTAAVAAATDSEGVDFLVLTFVASENVSPPPDQLQNVQPGNLDTPVLWMFAGSEPERLWRDQVAMIRKSPEQEGAGVFLFDTQDPHRFPGTDHRSGEPWMDRLSPVFMDTAAPWITRSDPYSATR